MFSILFLILQLLTPEQIGFYVSNLTKASRSRNKDSLLYYYNELRNKANSQEENYLYAYANGLAIFLILTSDRLYANEQYVDSAILYLEKCTQLKPDFSDAYAVLGSLYGMKAIMNLSHVIYWRKRSEEAFQKAKSLDPENPRVYYLEGISFFFRPKTFGGGKEKAKENFEKALVLYQKEKNPLSWGYMECKAFLGFVYEKMNMKEKAIKVYDEILQQEPTYLWVKEARQRLKN